MGAVPAKIAGVARVIVLSPAAIDGTSAGGALCVRALRRRRTLRRRRCAGHRGRGVWHGLDRTGRKDRRARRRVDDGGETSGLWPVRDRRACRILPKCSIVADDGANSEYVVGELLAHAELPGSYAACRALRIATATGGGRATCRYARSANAGSPRVRHAKRLPTRCRLIEASAIAKSFSIS